MSRIISSIITPAKSVERIVARRTRRVCIEATAEGRYNLVAEQEDPITLDGEIASVSPAPSIVITHDEIVKNKDLGMVQAALVKAIDAKGQALDEAIAKQAISDIEPIVIDEDTKP